MAGNVRFESSNSAIQDELGFGGSYGNGQRMSQTSSSLDRSGNYRDGGESRMFGLGSSSSRGIASSTGDLPTLSQFLLLDPIKLGEHKYPRPEELKKVFEMSFGTNVEDSSFGPGRLKLPLAVEELKRFRACVLEATNKARGRARRMDESLHKLNKYCESQVQKKQIRNEILTNERPAGPSLLKKGSQVHRNSPDVVNQRLEDRAKNNVLSKRVRTSVAELRAEGRTNNVMRQPPPLGRDRDLLRDGGEVSDLVEEKIRKLPTGESWDRRMKRKRTVGTVLNRPLDGEGELKRVMLHKLNNEPGGQSSESQSVRSGSSSGISGMSKGDGSSLPTGSSVRIIPKAEPEKKPTLYRDPTGGQAKDRLQVKGNNKLNVREDNHVAGPYLLAKGKGSRAPRSGSTTAGSSSPNISRMSGALDSWEQPPITNKFQSVNGANNRKRPMPSGSSSPPMAQWVVQRPQKMSRTRRSNLLSPVSNHDDVQGSEGSPSDFGGRMASPVTSGSFLARNLSIGSQQVRVKQEVVSSPARLSESEESGAGENHDGQLKEKGSVSGELDERMLVSAAQNNAPNIFHSMKNKVHGKEEIRDSARRQGRSGRGSSFSRVSVSPSREKLETPTLTKPLKGARPGSEKNGSKSGRPPLKKLSDRKAFTRVSQTSAVGSPDCTGESDDDREELLEAANYACNPSYVCCSSSFWWKMEFLFAPVSQEDESFLKQQISLDKNDESFSEILDHENTIPGTFVAEEDSSPQAFDSGRKSQFSHESQNMLKNVDQVDEAEDFVTLSGKLESEKRKIVTPLYQRVLSALIVEDETEEYQESRGTNMFSHYGEDGFPGVMHPSVNVETGNSIGITFESESDPKTQQIAGRRFTCNGGTTFTRRDSQSFNDDMHHADHGYQPLNNGYFPELHENGLDGSPGMHLKEPNVSVFNCPYGQMSVEDKLMLELQSIGLFPETVPDLADGEEDNMNQEILELEKKLNQQVVKTKVHGNKIIKAIEEGRKTEERSREQFAMDRLVQLACLKQLATRGSSAAKLGISKVSKQVASSFMKRTLARCRRFEDTQKSCFSEPALRDILTRPSNRIDADVMNGSFPGEAYHSGLQNHKSGRGLLHSSDQDFTRTGPIVNRGKKKEVLLDDVGSACMRVVSTVGNNSLAGAKGKRSERERDKDMSARLCVNKAGRSSAGDFRAERKTKTKPKPKAAQLSPAGNRFVGKLTDGTYSDNPATRISNEVANDSTKKEFTVVLPLNNATQDSSKEISECTDFTNLQLHDLDSIELGVGNELGGPQDLDSWLNIDEDGLQDHDAVGLEIPMDDLADLNMLL
ncbi:uncharacterized protein LOC111487166 [Cucurbita maxima]|uniref:Uncharacterized protein LOC111487166 n=1 Tax=Cucurbita maxima TaxID=3661 RepID=A0A6J1JPH2_CUCMA|nr:uncharacterized protein LOC111487166 [Cucurbita maxima]XP_022990204.1 uncharacterized protein LOC111487166 [Cucurbita maxima]XP_022990205.1 uncharacterized protein LOC111487166 [Cucurbita maxima]XP_022990206.1 uncharacterized protein LOC111487166 [Cucurbita maxima]XP_022990207.1 uncharacterized protein LOC111487166 [Cucurbita maxima]